jgi:hypothetical protein
MLTATRLHTSHAHDGRCATRHAISARRCFTAAREAYLSGNVEPATEYRRLAEWHLQKAQAGAGTVK